MLRTLKLTNFKRHRDLSIDFTDGIQCIRGANENGKSSIISAIAYALFGAKALNLPLEQCVTWGEPVASLKVVLSICQGADYYTFTRSKGSSEILKNGTVFVTGQVECSNFAAQMVGADLSTAQKLFLASQNGIRGALEEGPKALSTLIEDLAGFSTFDQILEAASQKLSLGSPALLEERLKGAEATLEAATAALPVAPDEDAHAAEVKVAEDKISEVQASIEPLRKAADALVVKHREDSAKFLRRNEMRQAAQQAAEAVKSAALQIESLREAASIEVDVSSIDKLKAQIAEAENYEARKAAYAKFNALPSGDRYGATLEVFESDAASGAMLRKQHEKRIVEIDAELAKLAFRRINHDKCDKCGQDITHLLNVKETNDRVDAETAKLNTERGNVQIALDSMIKFDEQIASVRNLSARFNAALRGIESFVTLDDSTYPPKALWIGNPPTSPTPHAPRDELAAIEAQVKAVDAAKAKLELAVEQSLKAVEVSHKAEAALAATDGPSAEEILRLTEERDAALVKAQSAEGNAALLNQQLKMMQQSFNQTKQVWDSAHARITDAQKTIDACKADLNSLDFNNTLVKKLRAVRPLIADKLWATVLASVSVMFSQMRGETSIVTKGKDGFAVNDQAIESLSGSTLDILGIALRCALLRTFIPNCGLLVLDEPAQGCDTVRTESLLGFLQGFGMTQTLLITHESISESIADNIIQLD